MTTMPSTPVDGHLSTTADALRRVVDEIERAVVGKRAVVELALVGLLADGHLLLDDLPGVAKTLLARSIAATTGLSFNRVQFTPDLLPADVTGSTVLDPTDPAGQTFRPGPVFCNLLLADEINRAPAKTQSALLEAMQERQVTVDGITHALPSPFLVVATQNPIELEGTYPLPEAQLDRFLLRSAIGYPDGDAEWELVRRRLERGVDEVALDRIVTAQDFVQMQRSLEAVHVDERIGRYAVAIVDATRSDGQLEVGSSPRGTLALVKLARGHAVLAGRDFVTPDDLKAIAAAALAHRVVLRSELWVRRIDPATVIARILDTVPAPSWR